jgi:hypothetical protein
MAANLIEALAAFLRSDAPIVAAFPTGFENGEQDITAQPPYGVFVKANTQPLNVLAPGLSIDKVTIQFHSLASSAMAAEAMGTVLKSRLLAIKSPPYTPTPLVFGDGREVGRFKVEGETTSIDEQRGPGNTDLWRNTIPIVWTVARG